MMLQPIPEKNAHYQSCNCNCECNCTNKTTPFPVFHREYEQHLKSLNEQETCKDYNLVNRFDVFIFN